jgi:Icc-related predicted phosphoesterase
MAKILAVSDIELPYIYKSIPGKKFKDIDLIISCGDLPYAYLEYILTLLNKDLYFVRGNHAPEGRDLKVEPEGARNLHMKTLMTDGGLLLAGIEGSLLYNYGPYQYTQAQMWLMVYRLVPKLIMNYIKYGRYLDVFVTHAPPWNIHDQADLAHKGIKAFRWLIKSFKPKLHLHGHTKDYLSNQRQISRFGETTVINVTGYHVIEV